MRHCAAQALLGRGPLHPPHPTRVGRSSGVSRRLALRLVHIKPDPSPDAVGPAALRVSFLHQTPGLAPGPPALLSLRVRVGGGLVPGAPTSGRRHRPFLFDAPPRLTAPVPVQPAVHAAHVGEARLGRRVLSPDHALRHFRLVFGWLPPLSRLRLEAEVDEVSHVVHEARRLADRLSRRGRR